jgi:HPr kinase/phosphorylase
VEIRQIILAINPGKNVTVIAETIAMNHLIKMYGHHTPREFNERLKEYMKQKDIVPLQKDMDYLTRDFE